MKIEAKNAVVRKTGYLYYVDGKGNVCSTPMKRKKKTATKAKTKKKKK
jgi:hypothetical protein